MTYTLTMAELRALRAIVASGLSVTRAAQLLSATQPGVSRHLLDAEAALGVQLFVRHKKRLVSLTAAAECLLPLADRALSQIEDLPRIARQFADSARGSLCVATSQTHARYLLPKVIQQFIKDYPMVDLQLKQGHLNQIAGWVTAGEADISLSAAPPECDPELLLYEYGAVRRVLLVPAGHPFAECSTAELSEIANWPLITYESQFSAFTQIDSAFAAAGLTPRYALTTSDTDTMKVYVRAGLGLAIVADAAFDAAADRGLAAVDVGRLFPVTPMYLGVRKDRPVSVHALNLIESVAPELKQSILGHAAQAADERMDGAPPAGRERRESIRFPAKNRPSAKRSLRSPL